MKPTLPIALLLIAVSSFASNSKEDPDLLYQQAVIPWEQGRENSWELMLKAADAGSTKALCRIARAYQGTSLISSDTADEYFTKAAELGGLCGMIALSNLGSGFQLNADLTEDNGDMNWTQKAIEVAEERIKSNDIDALKSYAFIKATEKDYDSYCDWMEKAAELGDADAMKQLAGHIKDGCGWYLIPGSREKAVKYWMERSANSGNPVAMRRVADEYCDAGDFKQFLAWYNKAVEMGEFEAIRSMITVLRGDQRIAVCPMPEQYWDKSKSYAYLYIIRTQVPRLFEVTESEIAESYLADKYSYYAIIKNLEKELPPEQIQQAKKWGDEWMKTHQVRTYGLTFTW